MTEFLVVFEMSAKTHRAFKIAVRTDFKINMKGKGGDIVPAWIVEPLKTIAKISVGMTPVLFPPALALGGVPAQLSDVDWNLHAFCSLPV